MTKSIPTTITRNRPTKDQLQRLKYCLISFFIPVRDCKDFNEIKDIYEKNKSIKEINLETEEKILLKKFGLATR